MQVPEEYRRGRDYIGSEQEIQFLQGKIVVPRSLFTVVETLKNQGVSKSKAVAASRSRNRNNLQRLSIMPRITHTRKNCKVCILSPPKNKNIGENNVKK